MQIEARFLCMRTISSRDNQKKKMGSFEAKEKVKHF